MTIYIWHTGHPINEQISLALHAGIPNSILKHTEWADNYIASTNKHVAIGYGILRRTADVFRHNAANNIDYYEVDRGYINPSHYEGYYRISRNALQATYKEQDLPGGRLDRLKFEKANWHHPKGQIIVCPPSEYIENHCNFVPGWWEREIVKVLENGNRSFKVREKSDTTPLEHDLKDAYCVITFNSNVAVDAAIKGVPVVTGAHSIAGRWCGNSLTNVVDGKIAPPTAERVDKLLRFISHNQFTLEEMRDGSAWKTLQAAYE